MGKGNDKNQQQILNRKFRMRTGLTADPVLKLWLTVSLYHADHFY